MSDSATCHACAAGIPVRLRHNHGSGAGPAGCCAQCQSFACALHGQRDSSTQQFRCIECLPAFLMHSAIRHSNSDNELAKTILDRSPGTPRAWHIENAGAFLAQHDLICDRTATTLSEVYQCSTFDLGVPGLNRLQWEKALRDLRRIQFRLDSTPQKDLLKLAAAFLAFLYRRESGEVRADLPRDMQALIGAFAPGVPSVVSQHADAMLAS